MSAAAAAELERAIRRICDEHGLSRSELRTLAEQLLTARRPGAGDQRVVFRAVEETDYPRWMRRKRAPDER